MQSGILCIAYALGVFLLGFGGGVIGYIFSVALSVSEGNVVVNWASTIVMGFLTFLGVAGTLITLLVAFWAVDVFQRVKEVAVEEGRKAAQEHLKLGSKIAEVFGDENAKSSRERNRS